MHAIYIIDLDGMYSLYVLLQVSAHLVTYLSQVWFNNKSAVYISIYVSTV